MYNAKGQDNLGKDSNYCKTNCVELSSKMKHPLHLSSDCHNPRKSMKFLKRQLSLPISTKQFYACSNVTINDITNGQLPVCVLM